MVRLMLELPVRIVAWLAQFKDQAGLRSRGPLPVQLLKELANNETGIDADT